MYRIDHLALASLCFLRLSGTQVIDGVLGRRPPAAGGDPWLRHSPRSHEGSGEA